MDEISDRLCVALHVADRSRAHVVSIVVDGLEASVVELDEGGFRAGSVRGFSARTF